MEFPRKIFGYRIKRNPFDVEIKMFCDTFKQPKDEQESIDMVERAITIESLSHENRSKKNCIDCEITWSFYKNVLSSIQAVKMLQIITDVDN